MVYHQTRVSHRARQAATNLNEGVLLSQQVLCRHAYTHAATLSCLHTSYSLHTVHCPDASYRGWTSQGTAGQ